MFYRLLVSFIQITLALGFISQPIHTSLVPVTGTSLDTTSGSTPASMPTLPEFIRAVTNNTSAPAGIYVSNTLAFPIVQQPSDNSGFVSTKENVVTNFAFASQYKSTGLLAHNYLAGAQFPAINNGQHLALVLGNGSVVYYKVTAIRSYQALQPYSPYSNFIDLADTTRKLSATDLFMETYGIADRLVLQTCIDAEGIDSWGRLFIIAEPDPTYRPTSPKTLTSREHLITM
jgi:hypothetical protein